MSDKRLIEVAFPLEQVSLDSVHEKNVRHGHISTLHIWPARRPLAASRAALIATLLPDPGNARERQAIYRRMAGKVVESVEDERVGGRTMARRKRKTQGGILHWKRENGQDVDWFRTRIRDAYDGRAAVRAAAAGAAGPGRGGQHGRRSAERGARCRLPEGPAESALDGDADRRVSVGAHGPLQGCRATIPLLKTRWLAKKGAKRVRLTMAPNAENAGVVFGIEVDVPPGKATPRGGASTTGGWRTLFTNRQLLALGTFLQEIRRLPETMVAWPEAWREAMVASLAPTISRLADRGSSLATWTNDPEKVRSTFARFALPMVWDFVEACPLADTSGGFVQAVEWTAEVCEHLLAATHDAPAPAVLRQSAAEPQAAANGNDDFDLICTDPPYYDAIPYSDMMDFFHVWLRRALRGCRRMSGPSRRRSPRS